MKLLKRRTLKRWPEGAVVYQIYPRSFYDSNNDGIGDIPGITEKIPYLKKLGINAIWLSPFYPSPMADFGYDVADYCDVDPIFGTLSDFDALVRLAHANKIKVLVDLVPNHSSDEHAWFHQSRQSREGDYADWYVWHDPKGLDKDGIPLPPNNWLSIFTGKSAWEWEPARSQFYLHSFDVKQPDLNWANPHVREAIKDVMRFWLDRGVDGFRVDAVRFMGKDPTFADNPKNPHHKKGQSHYGSLLHLNSQGWPQLYAYLSEMAAVLKEEKYRYSSRFMITESYPETHEPVEEYMAYYQGMDPEVAAPFIFEGLGMPWHAEPWRKFLVSFHAALERYSPLCVASYAFGNHDQHRLASRLGDEKARSAAVLLLTLPGMAFIYNGEEIGMTNGEILPSEVQDPAAQDGPGRDPERTPMHWSDKPNAGFTSADKSWLPIAKNYKERNVKVESRDPRSYLTLYLRLIKLRNKSNALRYGDMVIIETDNNVLIFSRTKGLECHIVLVNFTDEPVTIKLPRNYKLSHVLISSLSLSKKKKVKNGTVYLGSHEAVIVEAKKYR